MTDGDRIDQLVRACETSAAASDHLREEWSGQRTALLDAINGERTKRFRIVRWLFYVVVILTLVVAIESALVVSILGAINQERKRNTLVSCLDTNKRHRDTVKLVARIPDPSTKQFTLSLVNTLAPLRADCRAYAEERVQSP